MEGNHNWSRRRGSSRLLNEMAHQKATSEKKIGGALVNTPWSHCLPTVYGDGALAPDPVDSAGTYRMSGRYYASGRCKGCCRYLQNPRGRVQRRCRPESKSRVPCTGTCGVSRGLKVVVSVPLMTASLGVLLPACSTLLNHIAALVRTREGGIERAATARGDQGDAFPRNQAFGAPSDIFLLGCRIRRVTFAESRQQLGRAGFSHWSPALRTECAYLRFRMRLYRRVVDDNNRPFLGNLNVR